MGLGPNERVIREAVFDKPALLKYHWVSLFVASAFVIILPITMCVGIVYLFILKRMVDSWSCTLTDRALHVKSGVFVKTEKTVPLDKITDLLLVQGPIMRRFGLSKVSVETAGQSSNQGAHLVSLIGITGTEEFRLEVLEQRDLITRGERTASPTPATAGVPTAAGDIETTESLLADIRDGIGRMEEHLRRMEEKS
jgi:putative membrane protein